MMSKRQHLHVWKEAFGNQWVHISSRETKEPTQKVGFSFLDRQASVKILVRPPWKAVGSVR